MFEKSPPPSNSFDSVQKRWNRVQKRRQGIQKDVEYYNWRAPQFKFW